MGQCEAPDYSVKFCKVLSVAPPPPPRPHEDGVRVSGKSPQEMWRGQWLSDIALELFCGVVGG